MNNNCNKKRKEILVRSTEVRGVDDRCGKYRPTNGVEYKYNGVFLTDIKLLEKLQMEVICFIITIFFFCIFIYVYTDYINNYYG